MHACINGAECCAGCTQRARRGRLTLMPYCSGTLAASAALLHSCRLALMPKNTVFHVNGMAAGCHVPPARMQSSSDTRCCCAGAAASAPHPYGAGHGFR